MRTAKISELKAKLSAHIEYVKRGEEVLILDRDTPVAKLVSVDSMDQEDDGMRQLIARGIIVPPKDPRNKSRFEPHPAGPFISQEVMDRIWEEEREDR
jgi:prevent-host-death family protein